MAVEYFKTQFLIVEQTARGGSFLYTILKEGIGTKLIQKQWNQAVLVVLVDEMKYWQYEITSKVQRLDGIVNELSISEKMIPIPLN